MPFPNNSLAHTGGELSAAAQGIWHLVTRLGEAQILLPAMAAALLWLLISARDMSTARRWLLFTALAAALTTATKVAFIGYELGYAPLDYTGISGHAMFAAAILPVLTGIAAAGTAPRWRAAAIGAGYVLAAVVAYSRWRVGAHSPVEAIAGLALGSLASATVLHAGKLPHSRPPLWLGVGLLLWMSSLPLSAPPSMTHDWVIRLSLAVSDRSAPYQRAQMHRDYLRDPRRRQAAQSLVQCSTRYSTQNRVFAAPASFQILSIPTGIAAVCAKARRPWRGPGANSPQDCLCPGPTWPGQRIHRFS